MRTPDTGPTTADTRDLLRRAQQGERSALDALASRYLPRLRRWASGRVPHAWRDIAQTTDLVQDVLVHTLARVETLKVEREGGLAAYLRQAVLNRVRDELRRARRRSPSVPLDETLGLAGPSLFDALVTRESVERYERALSRLRPAEREVLVARLEMGCTFEEVAELTGRPSANAARMAVHRALLHLLGGMRHVR